MAPHVYLEALNKALNAELLNRGGAATPSAPLVPTHFRPASNTSQTVAGILSNARSRVETNSEPAQAVATLALELARLQNDLAGSVAEGLEEWIGGEYASLEAVRRAIAEVVVDDEEREVVAVALDRAAQLLPAAA